MNADLEGTVYFFPPFPQTTLIAYYRDKLLADRGRTLTEQTEPVGVCGRDPVRDEERSRPGDPVQHPDPAL